jgi:hypothetical protein
MEKCFFFFFNLCKRCNHYYVYLYLLSFMNVLNKMLVSSKLHLFLVVRILIFRLKLDGLKLKVDNFYLKQKVVPLNFDQTTHRLML